MTDKIATDLLVPDSTAPGKDVEGQVRAMQIQAVVRLTPLTAAVNALNASIVCAVFWGSVPAIILLGWAALVLVAMGSATFSWYKTRGIAAPKRASERAIRRAIKHSAILALLWALPPAVLITSASSEHQLFLLVITSGMMCAGGFALSTIRGAGTTFPVILGLGAAIALTRSGLSVTVPMTLLLLIYAMTVVVSVVHTSKTFRARIIAELRAAQQSQVIGLLLHDFEQHTADVLWETNGKLQLHQVSTKLADLLCCDKKDLDGECLPELITGYQSNLPESLRNSADSALHRLQEAFTKEQAFRDLELPLQISNQVSWWSFTAKPLESTGWRGVISDVTVAHNARHHVWQLAHHDAVTGLANRHQFQQVLEEAITEARDGHWLSAVLCIDLDNFKTVNDALGHAIGDCLLTVVGQRLKGQSRRQDLVARIGGDEFGIILRHLDDTDEAIHIAERILQTLRTPCDVDGVNIPISACLGLAFSPHDGVEPDAVLKNADLALYAGKAEGRNQLRFFTQEMSLKVTQRLQIERGLREALAKGQLRLAYQPQHALGTASVIGFEALARWHHPELGEVSPIEFIPVAEECGLIKELGAWALNEACQQACNWPELLTVAVNLSPLQLAEQDIVSQVSQALADSGLEAQRLELEITESVLINDTTEALSKLHQLRRLGVRIALDDFGTGYSAMAYLRHFPFDKLKIDRSFISEIAERPDALAIVRAIIEMSHALEMVTVAEGVESDLVLDLLNQQGCDAAQGYLISRPIEVGNVGEFLATYKPSIASPIRLQASNSAMR